MFIRPSCVTAVTSSVGRALRTASTIARYNLWHGKNTLCPVLLASSSPQRKEVGKKKKTTMGRGRPSKKPSSLEQTPETHTINIFKDIVLPKLINDMPSIDRFANLSQ